MARWHSVPFSELPRRTGLYALYEGDELVYIGKSGNVRMRVQAHRKTRRPILNYDAPVHGPRLVTDLQGVDARKLRVKVRWLRRGENYHETEVRLIFRLKPRCNRAGVRTKIKLFKTGMW